MENLDRYTGCWLVGGDTHCIWQSHQTDEQVLDLLGYILDGGHSVELQLHDCQFADKHVSDRIVVLYSKGGVVAAKGLGCTPSAKRGNWFAAFINAAKLVDAPTGGKSAPPTRPIR